MYFSDRENVASPFDHHKKQVRFNSSVISSPSDAQSPRPLTEIQNVNSKKLTLFCENDGRVSQKHLESVSKPLINDNYYLPPKLHDFNSKKVGESIPKPCLDLELSVFDSSPFVDNEGGRPRSIKDMSLDNKLLENDTPYSFSPSKMPLSNPLKNRSKFTAFPEPMVTSAVQSKNEKFYEKLKEDSTLDFFTKPFSNSSDRIQKLQTLNTKTADVVNKKISHVKSEEVRPYRQIQNFENGMQNENFKNRTNNCHFRQEGVVCNTSNRSIPKRHVTKQCCSCLGNNEYVDDFDKISDDQCCHTNYKRSSEKCCKFDAPKPCTNNRCCGVEMSVVQLDPVEEKRRAIEKRCKKSDAVAVGKKSEEPTVSDLFKIIQMQNEQLQNLQKRFEDFMTLKQNDACNPRTGSRQAMNNDQPLQGNEYQINNVNCVEHISIGVMTSFEMVMSSNYVNKQNRSVESDAVRIDEGVQTSPQICNEIFDNLQRPSTRPYYDFNPKDCKTNLDRMNAERNFLDGIDRVNNVPSPKRSAANNKVLDKIVEENHDVLHNERVQPDEIIRQSDDQNKPSDDLHKNGGERNGGWTFYNNVVNRVNNLLNSPPNLNSSKEKQTSPPQQMPITQPHKSPRDETPRVFTKSVPQPVVRVSEKPASELSLHMRQLASKYNISAPSNVQHCNQPPLMYRRPINGQMHHPQNVEYNEEYFQHFENRHVDGVNKQNVLPEFTAQNRFIDGRVPVCPDDAFNYGRQFNVTNGQYAVRRDNDYRQFQVIGETNANVYQGVATDVSFATLQYMQRYQLLTMTNEHPLPVPMGATPSRPLPPPYKNPSRILDITTLKQQPKLL